MFNIFMVNKQIPQTTSFMADLIQIRSAEIREDIFFPEFQCRALRKLTDKSRPEFIRLIRHRRQIKLLL